MLKDKIKLLLVIFYTAIIVGMLAVCLVLMASIFSKCADAKEIKTDGGYQIKYGLGLNDPPGASIGSIKQFALGIQKPAFWVFDYQLEGGAIVDTNVSYGRKNSAYGSGSLGLNVTMPYLYADSFWGIAFFSSTDSRLSSFYEFKQDLELGFRDKRDVRVGADYCHFSNSGIKLPNFGRDSILIKLQVPFGK